jgi:hypothetical protein
MAGNTFFNLNGAGFSSGADDPIMSLMIEQVDGKSYLKVVKRSGRCAYVTSRGLSSTPDSNTALSNTQTITLDTFAQLQAYQFKSGVPVYINVLNDENKNQEDTSYSWTGSTLKWNAEVEDQWQPTI